MSEELLQRDLINNPEKFGEWDFYNIGATSLKALKEYGIIRNVDYGSEEKKKVDALIVKKKIVIAVIEYKKPSEFKTEAQRKKAIKQELEVARKLDASILIATDTTKTIWVNVLTGNRIKDENGEELKFLFHAKDKKIPELIQKIKYSVNELNDQIKPKKLINPTDLAKSIWQDIWSVSGATPENCLYTFVELFIFKYLSDLGILGQGINFQHLQERYTYKLDNADEQALEYYANTIRPEIKKLFPEGKDKTTIINGTIFVSKDQKAVHGYSAVFKKVLGKFRDYGKLENIDYDFKSQLFESFLKESISKKNWGQFFTPLKVVRSIVEMAKDEIKPGVKICDPACGVGKFLLEPIVTKLDQFYDVKNEKLNSKITIHGFDKGFDKDEQKTIILAKANMLIYFSDLIKENPTITQEFSRLFNESFELKTNSILGTLSETFEDKYDLILTNPPYVTSGSSNLKEEIKKDGNLVNYYKINAMGVEGLFMEWIVKALKPNGKAFVVVPDGILNRQNDKYLRQFIIDECYIDGIISLPLKTFFTTPKKTYILCITKKSDKKHMQTDPVFTYLVSEIGESRDVYRFNIEQDDLTEAVTLYSFFKGSKTSFGKINNDKRCKVVPFDKFDPELHWSVDRWWSKAEQIELGILEEDKFANIHDFSNIVNDVSETLKDYSELLKEVSEKKKTVSNFKEIFLSDKSYFDLFIGSRLLKKDLILVNGDLPVYSANVNVPISFHNESNISDFTNNFVLWGIDGDFEYNFIPKNKPFVTTDHCGTIRILKEEILPEYLMLQLDSVKHKYGFDRGLRASLKNMKAVSIEIPFLENGNIDVEKQKEIIEKYEYVFELKSKIALYKNQIQQLAIEIPDESTTVDVPIDKIFDFPSTNSKITKEFCIKNVGDIPVYASSKDEKSVLGYIKDNLPGVKYYNNCLSWNRNGSVGYVFIRDHKFATNEDHRVLDIKIQYKLMLSTDYLKNVIEQNLLKNGFSFLNKCGLDKIKKIIISIPVTPEGKFDLEAQHEIAKKFKEIHSIKQRVMDELIRIMNTEINFE